jgi:hypothetical protein
VQEGLQDQMKHNITVVLAFTFLSACATAPNDQPQGPIATAADIPAAHAALKRSLKDPESVRYVSDTFKPGVVCGLFNSKNSYGGYGGNTLYLYVIATGEIMADEPTGDRIDDRAARARFNRYCPD